MNLFEITVSITCLSVLIGLPLALFYIRKLLKSSIPDLIAEQKAELRAEIEQWLNSERGQKALYAIGALVAQGAKDSLPFVSKGGKFKWTDLLGQIAGKYLGLGQGTEQQPQSSNIEFPPK